MINPVDVYEFSELQETMQLLPVQYMDIGKQNIFTKKVSPLSNVSINYNEGHISLLQSNGRETTKEYQEKGKIVTLSLPRFVHSEHIDSRDLQNYLSATGGGLANMNDFIIERLAPMRQHHELTHEWLRMGALKGVIYDGDYTVMADLFSAFGMTQQVFNFQLNNAATNVRQICMNVSRYFERIGMSGTPRLLVSPAFFDALINHPKVEKFYLNTQSAPQLVAGGIRKGFLFEGIEFVEYSATATDVNGVVRNFIEAGEGHGYIPNPMYFSAHWGPADFNDTVNLIPKQEVYVSIEPKQHNRGYHIHTQSNVLALPRNLRGVIKVLEI